MIKQVLGSRVLPFFLTVAGCILLWATTGNCAVAIAIAEENLKGQRTDVYGFSHHDNLTLDAVEKLALAISASEGGVKPKIVLSSQAFGYVAVAASQNGKTRIIGWAGPFMDYNQAISQAIAKCSRRGGTKPILIHVSLNGTDTILSK